MGVTNPSNASTAAVVTFNKAPSFSEDGYILNSVVSGGTLIFNGASSALTVDLSGSSEKLTGFTSISMATASKADKVTLTSDQIGSGTGKYSSFTGTLSGDGSIDDSVVVSGGSTKTLDLASLTTKDVGFNLANYANSVTMTANQFNAATFGGKTAVTLSGSGVIDASKYVELYSSDGTLTLPSGTTSLSINADANADQSSDGWSITTLPTGVTSLTISGAEGIDLSEIESNSFKLTSLDMSDAGAQTVYLTNKQLRAFEANGAGITGTNDDEIIVVDRAADSGNNAFIRIKSSVHVTYNPGEPEETTGVKMATSAADSTVEGYSTGDYLRAMEGGEDGSLTVPTSAQSGITFIGNEGADWIQCAYSGSKLYAGGLDGTDEIAENQVSPYFYQVYMGQEVSGDPTKAVSSATTGVWGLVKEANILESWGECSTSDTTNELHLSTSKDVVWLQVNGKESDGSTSSEPDPTPSANINVYNFNLGVDKFFITQPRVGDSASWKATDLAKGITYDLSAGTMTINWATLTSEGVINTLKLATNAQASYLYPNGEKTTIKFLYDTTTYDEAEGTEGYAEYDKWGSEGKTKFSSFSGSNTDVDDTVELVVKLFGVETATSDTTLGGDAVNS